MLHLSEGANAEYVSASKELFFFLRSKLEEIESEESLGGHAAFWVKRAKIEKCQVYSAIPPVKYVEDAVDALAGDFLVDPRELIYNRKDEWLFDPHPDIHLVLEYQEGDELYGYTAPRSNRFYFDHDPNNNVIANMEPYFDLLKQSDHNPYRHMFGGFQLM